MIWEKLITNKNTKKCREVLSELVARILTAHYTIHQDLPTQKIINQISTNLFGNLIKIIKSLAVLNGRPPIVDAGMRHYGKPVLCIIVCV
jgi:hypothetical protein